MTIQERREYEIAKYREYKENLEGQLDQRDGSRLYYVVDVKWMLRWKTFIQDDGVIPKEIDNQTLKSFIIDQRISIGNYKGFDNAISLERDTDYYVFS